MKDLSSLSLLGAFRRDPEDDSAERLRAAATRAGVEPGVLHESPGLVLSCDFWGASPDAAGAVSGPSVAYGFSGRLFGDACGPAARGWSEARASSILRDLATRGAGSVRTLDGPFLLALYDDARGEGMLIRDKFGAKQLFYLRHHERLWFSDHLLPLVRLLAAPSVRSGGLIEWLYYGAPLPHRTFFDEILTVPPGHLLRYESRTGAVASERHFDFCDEVSSELHRCLAAQETIRLERELDACLDRAIACYSQGQTGVTVLLSGGVDSSIITAMAARHTAVQAVTLDVHGEGVPSERRFAEAVARHVGVPLEPCRFGADDFRGSVIDTVYQLGTPTIVESAVALMHAAASGALPASQLILDGEGADALFGGSTSLFKFSMMGYFLARLSRLSDQRVEGAARWLRRKLSQLGLETRTPADSRGLDWLLGARGVERVARMQRLGDAVSHLSTRFAREIAMLMLNDFDGHLAPLLLRLDPCGRRVDSEIGLPFLETQMFSFSLNLPLEHKLHWSWRRRRPEPKWLLKRLTARLVPPEVVWRPKGGFEIPGGRWIGPLPARWRKDSFVASQFALDRDALNGWLTQIGENRDRMLLSTMEIWGRIFAWGESVDDLQKEWLSASSDA